MTVRSTPSPLALALRTAVEEFVTNAGTRRALPTVINLGTPGGEHVSLPESPSLDAGLRTDLLERALDGIDLDALPTPVPWLTRSGELAPGDADFAWLAAAVEAFGRHDLPVRGFFVVTRNGWFDLLSEDLVRWQRVRPRTTGV